MTSQVVDLGLLIMASGFVGSTQMCHGEILVMRKLLANSNAVYKNVTQPIGLALQPN